jgi:hypothetical protein
LAARDLHELMRAWEQYHRILSGEACGTSVPGRDPVPRLLLSGRLPENRRQQVEVFTISQYNKNTNLVEV